MKQKGFAPIIILFLASLAVVGYFGYKNFWQKIRVSPTPTANTSRAEPKDWKTYTNSNIVFSLKYPESLVIENVVDSSQFVKNKNAVFGFEFRNSKTKIAEYTFYVYKSDGKPIREWAEKFKNILISPAIKKPTTYKINNLDIYSYKYSSPIDLTDTGGRFPSPSPYEDTSEILLFLSEDKQKIYALQIFTANPENKSLANQILSTFRFLK